MVPVCEATAAAAQMAAVRAGAGQGALLGKPQPPAETLGGGLCIPEVVFRLQPSLPLQHGGICGQGEHAMGWLPLLPLPPLPLPPLPPLPQPPLPQPLPSAGAAIAGTDPTTTGVSPSLETTALVVPAAEATAQDEQRAGNCGGLGGGGIEAQQAQQAQEQPLQQQVQQQALDDNAGDGGGIAARIAEVEAKVAAVEARWGGDSLRTGQAHFLLHFACCHPQAARLFPLKAAEALRR